MALIKKTQNQIPQNLKLENSHIVKYVETFQILNSLQDFFHKGLQVPSRGLPNKHLKFNVPFLKNEYLICR